ncbi:MAG: ABC transporter permease [Spiroplasma sp.]|nr:ABC transporter permease [Spiroplasma sp.]
MFTLVKNVLRGVRRRLFQYLGIVVLLIIVVASMTGLYGSSERVSAGFYNVANNSGNYDYRIKVEKLNDFIDIDTALTRVKEVLKKEFPNTLPNYDTIINQIDKINSNDVQNNLLPTLADGIDVDLKLLLLNWGVNYKAILINDILNQEVKEDSKTSYYQIEKSFLKSFDINKKKQLFFSFEDAFYLEKMPPWLIDETLRFNFSPFRDGFNQVYIIDGRKPTAINEVIINPTFAKKNNITLNEEYQFLPDETLKVVGYGYTYWGIIGEPTPDNIAPTPNNTTQVFTTREWSNQYLGANITGGAKTVTPFFLKVKNKDDFLENKIENIFSATFNFNYGNLISPDTNDYRSGFLKQSFDMQNIIYSAISFFVMLAAVFIVLSYVRKEIDLQKKQIGLIKALGYSNNEVSFGFTFLIFIISIFSTVFGFVLGLPLQMYFNGLGNFGYVLPLPTIHFSIIGLVIGVILSTIIFTLASYLQSFSVLTKNPLTLIHDRTSGTSTMWLAFFKKPFNYWSFKPRLAISFALKSFGKLALIFFTFVFVSFLLLFQTIVSDVFDSKIDNLQNYVNSNVYVTSKTVDMYKFDSQGKITSQVYDWTIEKKIDQEKQLKSDSFHIDSQEKYDRLMAIYQANNFKGYYISSQEINLLYQNTHAPNNCLEYIKPPGTNFIPDLQAQLACTALTKFFDMITSYSGINPDVQPLPGIALGQIVVNNNYYPNLEFGLNNPAAWIGHDLGPMVSKRNMIVSLYNNSDLDNPLAWKSWFNLKEEHGLDIDPVFNSSHTLKLQDVTYIDSFGQEKIGKAYVLPTVISKSLAVLNKYKVNDQVLMILNANNKFVPVIFDIKGITITNLDMSHFYVHIDDLRKIIGYTDDDQPSGRPRQDAFNNYYSKDQSVLPLNSINIVQSNNDYSLTGLQGGWGLIPRDPLVFPLIKGRLIEMFQSIQSIIDITKWLTVIALAFVLVIIINMILDNNIMIIAMMKALGYRINEINALIIGSYIFALILAYIVGTILGYVTWWLILLLVAELSSTIFLLPVSAATILVSFVLIFLVITIGYIIGLYFIKFKPVTSLLQSE